MADQQDTPETHPWAPPSPHDRIDSAETPSTGSAWGAPVDSQGASNVSEPGAASPFSSQGAPRDVYSGWEPPASANAPGDAQPSPTWGAPAQAAATPAPPAPAPYAAPHQPSWEASPTPTSSTWAPMPQASAPWAPAQQPGVIPLRPLSVGELLEGTFRTIRANPAALFAFSLVVMSVIAVISSLLEYLTGSSVLSLLSDPTAALNDQATYVASAISSTLLSSLSTTVLSSLASMMLMGMLGLTVWDAVLGRKTSVADAWNRFKGRFVPLLLATLLVALTAFVVIALIAAVFVLIGGAFISFNPHFDETLFFGGILLFFVAGIVILIASLSLMTKLAYVTTAVVLEGLSPLAAFKRSWSLTRGAFWRTLGRLLLILLLTTVISSVLGMLTGTLTAIVAALGSITLAFTLATCISVLLQGLVLPITVTYQTLMYIDERIRKENIAPYIAAEAARL